MDDEKWKLINTEVDRFVDHIDSLFTTYPLVDLILKSMSHSASMELTDFFNAHATRVKDKEGKETRRVDNDKIEELLDLNKKHAKSKIAEQIIKRNFLVSLVSQFDAFLGGILRSIYIIKPEILNSSEKNISFSKLSGFSSLEDATDFIIEKEVESVIRESHAEHFNYLKKKLGIPFTKGLDSFASFIELTERRNLYVHTNGIVSSQYINVCTQHNYKFEEIISTGDVLDIDNEYFTNIPVTKCFGINSYFLA